MTSIRVLCLAGLFCCSTGVQAGKTTTTAAKTTTTAVTTTAATTTAATTTTLPCNSSGSGSVSSDGVMIINNSAKPGTKGLMTNVITCIGGKTFGDAVRKDTFDDDGLQIMQSDISGNLTDEIGVENTNSVADGLKRTDKELKFFSGGHLFDLGRLRAVADWLRVPSGLSLSTGAALAKVPFAAGVTPPSPSFSAPGTLIVATYGTISWAEFLDNLNNARTMYGIVRVLVPIQKGVCSGGGCTKNSLGSTVLSSELYGFCATPSPAYLCSSAPNSSTNIKPGGVVSGVTITAGAQIKVRGTLMFDFVDHSTGQPVSLANLPWDSRKLYFKVSVPISVNASNDIDGDGAMDNMDYISSLTSGFSCAAFPCSKAVTASISYSKVPQESKDAYLYSKGSALSNDVFSGLSKAEQYGLLFPSGYAQGWYDAFQALGLSASAWNQLGFKAPSSFSSGSSIRSSDFEDIPVYLYSGGLVDMHHHVNISGLVYVPQAVELEQKSSTSRQYINGAFIIRDSFFFEDATGGITIISNDTSTYNALKTTKISLYLVPDKGVGSGYLKSGGGSGSTGSSSGGSGGSSSGAGGVSTPLWMEVRPQF